MAHSDQTRPLDEVAVEDDLVADGDGAIEVVL